MALSILILTLNEENIIAECINSVKSISDDIIVFDSYSTDETVQIAKKMGARVYQRRFDNEKKHREASLKLDFKHEWVYNPDADEITTSELVSEIVDVVKNGNPDIAAYDIRFKVMFRDKWIKHSSLYPVWVTRLFKPEKVSFDREINLTYNIDGIVGRLESHFLHFTFNKGLEFWFEKHNKYSTYEAIETVTSLEETFNWKGLLNKNSTIRRKTLKILSFRLPCRPLLRFIYMYVIKLGFLDGKAGLQYCLMLSVYEYMIVAKVIELKT